MKKIKFCNNLLCFEKNVTDFNNTLCSRLIAWMYVPNDLLFCASMPILLYDLEVIITNVEKYIPLLFFMYFCIVVKYTEDRIYHYNHFKCIV